MPTNNQTDRELIYNPETPQPLTTEEVLNVAIAFGLSAQGHLKTVEKLRAEGEPLGLIAHRIGWSKEALCEHWAWHLEAALDAAERSITLEAERERLRRENACLRDRLVQLGVTPITKSQERMLNCYEQAAKAGE